MTRLGRRAPTARSPKRPRIVGRSRQSRASATRAHELAETSSQVKVVMVELPAVNTPRFDWSRSGTRSALGRPVDSCSRSSSLRPWFGRPSVHVGQSSFDRERAPPHARAGPIRRCFRRSRGQSLEAGAGETTARAVGSRVGRSPGASPCGRRFVDDRGHVRDRHRPPALSPPSSSVELGGVGRGARRQVIRAGGRGSILVRY